jgi:hypothetical protein
VRRVKLVALSGVAGLLTLALCDLALRFAVNDPVYMMAVTAMPTLFRYNAGGASDRTIVGDLGSATPDSHDDEPRRVVVTIDAHGFRNGLPTTDEAIDVVLLGDSFAFGFGTSQELTLASRLQTRSGLATYNLAMPWTGPWGQYVNLAVEGERLPLRKGGTVIWLLFSGNDLDDVYGDVDLQRLPRNGTAGQLVAGLKRLRNRSPIYRRLRHVTERVTGATPGEPVTVVMPAPFVNGRTMLFLKPYAEVRRRTYHDVIAHPNYPALRQTLAAAAATAASFGVSLKVALAPSKEEVYAWVLDGQPPWSTPAVPSDFGRAAAELCAELEIEFLDLKPVFVETSKMLFDRSGETLWWYDDSHWNAHGHDLAAAVMQRHWLDSAAGHSGRRP